MRVGGSRRRGSVLEQTILDAAWTELADVGYVDLTMAGVASRAAVAKSVLYRRWPNKADLVHAVIERRVPHLGEVARTGNLETDLAAVLDRLVATCRDLQLVAGLDPELSSRLRRTRSEEATAEFAGVLAAAGLDVDAMKPRVLRLPVDLVIHDVLEAGRCPDPREIIDHIFLPLIRSSPDPRR